MESKHYVFLGNISYGIYMFHTSCIAIVITGLQKLGLASQSPVLFNIMLYGLSIATTIAVSAISYNHFEKWFLKWKNGFAVVKSGKKLMNEPNDKLQDSPITPNYATAENGFSTRAPAISY